MSLTAYLSRRVVFDDGVRPACIVVDDALGRIVRITEAESAPGFAAVVDCGEEALLPGLVDTHVHLNEPGRTEWEGFATGTESAAAGGVTTLVDMPLNCLPETTTVVALEAKRAAAAGKCTVDWRPWGGAVNGNQGHLKALAEAGVAGYKCFLLYPGCDGFGLIDAADLRLAMPLIAQTGLPLLVHAELAGPCEAAAKALHGSDWRQYRTYLGSRPEAAELEAIRWIIELSREFGTWVHIVHLSSAAALPMLREAKAEGLQISVETCPHYLTFAADEIPNGATLYKCAPPIRDAANRKLLWAGLRDGTIDLVASDHSPCPPEMKRMEEGSFATAWGGVASLSLGLPVIWTEASRRGFGLMDVARWMCSNPAQLAGLKGRKGRIAEGYDADFVVFSPEQIYTVTTSALWFRHKQSPYMGRQLQGRVMRTIVRGHTVFADGVFTKQRVGEEVAP